MFSVRTFARFVSLVQIDTVPSMAIKVLVAPFIRPVNRVGDTPPLPYYLYCLIGIAVIVFGVLYWTIWQLVLPYVFKFRLVPRKEVLEDGTVVTLVSRLRGFCMGSLPNGQGLTMASVLSRKGRKEDDTVMRDGTRNSSVDNVIELWGAQRRHLNEMIHFWKTAVL